MTPGSLVFMLIAGALILLLPRRAAAVPLLLAASYTTRAPVLELGPANLSVLRVVVVIGMIRVLARGERLANGMNAVDRWLLAWALLLIGASVFHTSDAWTFRIGLVLGEVGVYLLLRVFVQDMEDVRRLFRILCVALVPLATMMLYEKFTLQNLFSIVGASGQVVIRDGHARAAGPFGHPILAGTVGATCVPMAVCLWRSHRFAALLGLYVAAGIVLASTSSGPIMMVAFTCVGLFAWRYRSSLGLIRWGTVAALVVLQIVMKDPVYFLMARIDLTGSSTGWHRAALVRSSIQHLGEWWAVGTDITRHWMPTGIHADEIHTDITNHFLAQGVMGGLPLLIVFVLMLVAAFRAVGRALQENEDRSPERAFFTWAVGAMLFGQVMNFWSISLFDQTVSFFYLVLATIGALQLPVAVTVKESLSFRPELGKREGQTVIAHAPAAAGRKDGAALLPGRAGWAGKLRGDGARQLSWGGKQR